MDRLDDVLRSSAHVLIGQVQLYTHFANFARGEVRRTRIFPIVRWEGLYDWGAKLWVRLCRVCPNRTRRYRYCMIEAWT